MAASTLIKWKPGKTGFYTSLTLDKAHWVAQGFEDAEDTKELVFDRSNNFTIVGDSLSMAQMDFLEENADFLIRKNADSTKTKPTAKQALTQSVVSGVPVVAAREVEAGNQDAAPSSSQTTPVDDEDEVDDSEPKPKVDEVDPDEAYENSSQGV